jgi:CheY-like chemotaxis protein
LEICRQLLKAMSGSLEIAASATGEWQAYLLWPTLRQGALLVVDNNASFIELFRRYLARYSWNGIGATSSADARQILTELQPAAIVLDVMMPKEDGWQLLHTIRANRSTQKIPVIICSVLNEPELAQTLGATPICPSRSASRICYMPWLHCFQMLPARRQYIERRIQRPYYFPHFKTVAADDLDGAG